MSRANANQFLSQDTIEELTGIPSSNPAQQIQFLCAHNIRCLLNKKTRVIVAHSWLNYANPPSFVPTTEQSHSENVTEANDSTHRTHSGRRKRSEDSWMPNRVYRGKSQFELHPRSGGSVSLCPLNSTREEVLRAYEQAENSAPEVSTVSDLIRRYCNSHSSRQCEPSEVNWHPIERRFGAIDCKRVTSRQVKSYTEKREKESKIDASLELALLNKIFEYALEHGLVDSNPCHLAISIAGRSCGKVVNAGRKSRTPLKPDSDKISQIVLELSSLISSHGQSVLRVILRELRREGLLSIQESSIQKILEKQTGSRSDYRSHQLGH